jgi:hypothetical protein
MSALIFIVKWLFILTGGAVWIGLTISLIAAVIMWLLCPAEYRK